MSLQQCTNYIYGGHYLPAIIQEGNVKFETIESLQSKLKWHSGTFSERSERKIQLKTKEFHPLDFETQTGITTLRSEIDLKLTTVLQSRRFRSFDLLRNINEALSLRKTRLIQRFKIEKLKDYLTWLPLPDNRKLMLPSLGILIEI